MSGTGKRGSALSNNPLTTSRTNSQRAFFFPPPASRPLLLFVRKERWREEERGEETERQWTETAILSSPLSVTVANRWRAEELLLLTEMSVRMSMQHNDGETDKEFYRREMRQRGCQCASDERRDF